LRQLHAKFAHLSDVVFIVLVQREPHAGRMGFRDIAQPTTLAERTELANRLKDEFGLKMNVLVDSMDDASRALYSQLPGPLFIIGPNQQVIAKHPWMDAALIETEISKSSKIQ
jgi:hypothetical protein